MRRREPEAMRRRELCATLALKILGATGVLTPEPVEKSKSRKLESRKVVAREQVIPTKQVTLLSRSRALADLPATHQFA